MTKTQSFTLPIAQVIDVPLGASVVVERGELARLLRENTAALQVQAWLYAADGSLIEYVRSIHNPALISIELQSTRSAA